MVKLLTNVYDGVVITLIYGVGLPLPMSRGDGLDSSTVGEGVEDILDVGNGSSFGVKYDDKQDEESVGGEVGTSSGVGRGEAVCGVIDAPV